MANAQTRIRMDPEERKSRLSARARAVFAANGYAATGLQEVAKQAGVTRGLIYHYYPAGRPELYVNVMDLLHHDLMDALEPTLNAPFRTEKRIELFVEAFADFFVRNSDAYRLLFREPPGSGEPTIMSRAVAVQVSLESALAKVIARTAAPAGPVQVATAGTIGFLLHACSLLTERCIDRATIIAAASTYINAGVRSLETSD